MSADVFISYSGERGRELAEELYNQFDALGVNTFLDQFSIKSGQIWKDKILQGVKSCKCLIFIATEESCRSACANQEVGIALGQEKEIIPILVDGMSLGDLPDFLKDRQATTEDKIAPLVKHIEGCLQSKKNTLIIAGIVGIIALILLSRK